jgi:hypothetical protein
MMDNASDDSFDLNSPVDDTPKREMDRDSLFLKAVLTFDKSGASGEVRIRNLSSGGMLVEAPVHAKRGDSVSVELRNIGVVTGTIAWVAQDRFGVAFNHVIDPKLARKPIGQAKIEMPSYLRTPKSKYSFYR